MYLTFVGVVSWPQREKEKKIDIDRQGYYIRDHERKRQVYIHTESNIPLIANEHIHTHILTYKHIIQAYM